VSKAGGRAHVNCFSCVCVQLASRSISMMPRRESISTYTIFNTAGLRLRWRQPGVGRISRVRLNEDVLQGTRNVPRIASGVPKANTHTALHASDRHKQSGVSLNLVTKSCTVSDHWFTAAFGALAYL
jgi:hypothetical protein